MRHINDLLVSLLSNVWISNNTRKVSITFAISLIFLSFISGFDLSGAQLMTSQDDQDKLRDASRIYEKPLNPKTECNSPIDVKNVSSSSPNHSKNDEMNGGSVIDNDEDTEWSVDRAGDYLEFDIGAIRSICDIEILWDDGDEKSYNFVVSVSENGVEFKDSIRTKSSGNSDLAESYPIPNALAKQIRLTVYGNSEDEIAAIKEVSINGRDVRKVGQAYKICEDLPIDNFVATSNQSGDPPENAADGDFMTSWSNLGVGFIQADLGEIKSVCGINIAWYNGESRQYEFEASVSKDGINFHQVYEGISNGKSIRPQNYPFSDVDARYVRITVFGNDKNGWAGITELSIEGYTPPLPPNKPPVADSKSVSTDMNVPISITLSGSDPEGSTLTYTIADLPKHGQLSSVSHDTVKYTPDKDYAGSDGFTYTAKDNKGATSGRANISIDINEVLECQILNPSVVTAIGSDGNAPSNVVDRNLNTRWSNKGTGSWIQVDLGSKAKVCSVDLAWYRGDVRKNDFTVSLSDDGSRFKRVFEGESTGTGTGFEKYNLPSGTEGRFVRIAVNNNSENNWASITELALFGVASGSPPSSQPPSTPAIPPSQNDTGNDAGANDKFGIKKIYSTKPGGEEWYMNMQGPENDPRTKTPSMSKNSDGSWKITSGKVRYSVYTSSGYHPDDVVKDHSVLATRGYMQNPNDWKNVEMTGQVRFNSGGDDEWTYYARGGRHTSNGWPDGCEGAAYKGSLDYTGGQVRWAKEQWHVSYVFQPWKNSTATGDGKFVGFKTVMYNIEQNGKTVVKLESYVDPNNNNQWQKVYEYIDKGGWGGDGIECKGSSDQVLTWGGPSVTFRWDDGDDIDIKNLSVREIVPPK
jgi:hypothetical protein